MKSVYVIRVEDNELGACNVSSVNDDGTIEVVGINVLNALDLSMKIDDLHAAQTIAAIICKLYNLTSDEVKIVEIQVQRIECVVEQTQVKQRQVA